MPTTYNLDDMTLPGAEGPIDWGALNHAEIHHLMRGLGQLLRDTEPNDPTAGVLERSIALEDTVRAMEPLKCHYAGLIHDAYQSPTLRATLGLPKGKTPFRDAPDLIAKTHGLRAYEASGRLKLAAAITPVRATSQRDDDVAVGTTKYPRLGALQTAGTIHPTKFATAVKMLEALDDEAQRAGKVAAFRQRLLGAAEQELTERIEHTTPEEFTRYVSRRKADVLAGLNPPGSHFTQAQTDAMHGLWPKGQVRGNPDAYEWRLVTSAEGHEALKTLEGIANNPRSQSKTHDDATAEPFVAASAEPEDVPMTDRRTRPKRCADALVDAVRFALERLSEMTLPGTTGNHTQMIVLADYPTLLAQLKHELAEVLPALDDRRRDQLIAILAGSDDLPDTESTGAPPHSNGASGSSPPAQTVIVDFPPPKSTDLEAVVAAGSLEHLQPRVAHGIHTPYIPPEVLLRMLCDVRVSPVTLTGERQVLSIGRAARQFPEHIRRALLARDRGCAAPGCHWPAAWCEAHHVEYWSAGGTTGTDNGVMLCGHHHAAVHAKQLRIIRENGVFKFIQHPLIDPTQTAQENYFWQY